MSFVVGNISDTCAQHGLSIYLIFLNIDLKAFYFSYAWKTSLRNRDGLSNTNWLVRDTTNIKNKVSTLKI